MSEVAAWDDLEGRGNSCIKWTENFTLSPIGPKCVTSGRYLAGAWFHPLAVFKTIKIKEGHKMAMLSSLLLV